MTIIPRIIVIKLMIRNNLPHHLIERLRSENRAVWGHYDWSKVKQIFNVGPIENTYYVIESNPETGDVIESDDGITAPLYWSNDEGWVPYYFCDHFDEDDASNYTPTDSGVWKKVNSITNFVMAKNNYTVVENVEIEGSYGQD